MCEKKLTKFLQRKEEEEEDEDEEERQLLCFTFGNDHMGVFLLSSYILFPLEIKTTEL